MNSLRMFNRSCTYQNRTTRFLHSFDFTNNCLIFRFFIPIHLIRKIGSLKKHRFAGYRIVV